MTLPKKSSNEIDGDYSSNVEFDEFWVEYGKESIKQTLAGLDERAKYMITTCASLIVINFGLLTAFSINSFSIKVSPQFFLVISVIFFVLSYFPAEKTINLQAPFKNRDAYTAWKHSKIRWHKFGFAFFIAGLFAMAVTTFIRNV